jgi:hypothetical protein
MNPFLFREELRRLRFDCLLTLYRTPVILMSYLFLTYLEFGFLIINST